jgi:hypothetical protein
MFSKKCWYNKNVAPKNPGILNFSIWFVKTGFLGAILLIGISLIIPSESELFSSIIIILFLPFIEEHGRIVFSINSNNKYMYSLKFGLLLFIGELITESMNELNINFQLIYDRFEEKYPAIITHIVLSIFLVILYKIRDGGYVKSIYTVWILASIFHLSINTVIDFFAAP